MKKRSKAYDQYKKLLDQGSYLEAAHFAELEYLNGDQNNSFWLTRQAAALSRSGDYEEAFGKAKQALSIQPENPYAVLAVADALSGLGRIKEALSYYEEIAADAKVSAYARKSIFDCLTLLKDWDRILQLLGQWEMPPDQSFRWRVNALAGQNRLDEAIEICHQWLRKSPGNRQGLWTLTELEIQRDGLDSVLFRMAKLAKIPSRPPVYKEIYASLCRRAGKPELALKQYTELSRSGADQRIHRQQAFALAKSGKELEAIPIMEELLKLNPKDLYIHSAYIPACKRAQQLARALSFYEKLLEANPEEKPLFGRIRKIKNLMEVPC